MTQAATEKERNRERKLLVFIIPSALRSVSGSESPRLGEVILCCSAQRREPACNCFRLGAALYRGHR